jgi:hypothetical protein
MKLSTLLRKKFNKRTDIQAGPLTAPKPVATPANRPQAVALRGRPGPPPELLNFYVASVAEVLARMQITCKIVKWFNSPRFISIGITLGDPTLYAKATQKDTLNAIAHKAGVQHVLFEHKQIKLKDGTHLGVILYQLPVPDGPSPMWGDADVCPLCIGIGSNADPVLLEEDVWDRGHVMVAGATGSGKSVLITAIMYALAQKYPPDQLGFILIDPHGDHYLWANEAHMLGPVAENPLQIASALSAAAHEARRRVKTKEWIKHPDKLKRLVVVIDEADGSEAFAKDIPELLKYGQAIATDGRKAKVNLILGTHRPSYAELKHVVDACTTRFLGNVSSAPLSGQFGAGLRLHWLMGKGDYIRQIGDQTTRFQSVFTRRGLVRSLDRHPKPLKPFPLPEKLQLNGDMTVAIQDVVPKNSPLRQIDPQVLAFVLKAGTDQTTPNAVAQALDVPVFRASVNHILAKNVEYHYRRL